MYNKYINNPIGDENMKLLRYSSISAMATINPQLCRQKSIQVEVEQTSEGPIPHLHVYLDRTRNPKKYAYIRLDTPEYLGNHDTAKLSKKQLEQFLAIMTSKWAKNFIQSIYSENIKVATGYEAAVNIWLDTYGERYSSNFTYDQDGFPVMPDYHKLNTT